MQRGKSSGRLRSLLVGGAGCLVVGAGAVAAPFVLHGAGQTAHAATQARALHVQGNQLVDAQGSVVRLTGVNHSGSEYSCIQGYGIFEGGVDQAAVTNTLAVHANAVRIPMNEDCWLGINGAPAAYSGSSYRSAISAYVDLLVQNGMTPILDLHWSAPGSQQATGQEPMPDADHSVTFWQQVAQAYAGRPQVMFDLYNEPYPASWACWRDGGAACSGDVPFAVAGMQQLVNTVRQAGANNVVMLGGLDYSNTLVGNGGSWAQYKPQDPTGNVMASWHIYKGNPCVTTACWDTELTPTLQSVPVFDGEFGAYDYNGANYDTAFGQSLLDWLDAHAVSGYTAWTWNNWGFSSSSSESLICSDDGSCLTNWGKWVQQQYAARNITTPPPAATNTPTTPPSAPTPTATQTQTPPPSVTPMTTATATASPSPSASPSPTPSPAADCKPSITFDDGSFRSRNPLPGHWVALTTRFTASCATIGLVDFEVYDQNGNMVHQGVKSNRQLTGSDQSFTMYWLLPSDLTPGWYTLQVGVFSPDWSDLYGWDDGAVSFLVQ